ncbi:histidinol dehydrogenase [Mangrovicoccus ximenensis]|uniref:histidinol dehydrogenase n=1 Tax=Mangrovicoccus ximenensis TaxID=1911570 RepID=UPI00191C60CE|nr:histidinol dehydrogenase [Mangrovicoccus ximenensis]
MTDVTFKVLAELSAGERAALFRRSETDLSFFLDKAGPIIEAVKAEGDAALVRFGVEFDKAEGLTAGGLKATEAEFDAAFDEVDPEVIEAIRAGIANIRSFHEEQAPEPMWLKEVRPGAFAGDRFLPIRSVALYVPRGKGAFPSVVMMTAVPAVVAGVPEIAIFTPPAPGGKADAATLVAGSAGKEAAAIPAIFFFSDSDQVVDPAAVRQAAAAWGAPAELVPLEMGPGDDPSAHVIAGDILSPGQSLSMADRVISWARGL